MQEYAHEDPDSPSGYINRVSDKRALRLTEEQATAGNTLLSAECQPDLISDTIRECFEDNLAGFLCSLKNLPLPEQDMMVCYYLLQKSQTQVGKVFSITQTLCSQRIIRALRTIAACTMWASPVEHVATILDKNNLSGMGDGHILDYVKVFAKYKSFGMAAPQLGNGVTPPMVRRDLNKLVDLLSAKHDQESLAMGAWLSTMVSEAEAREIGCSISKRQRESATVYFKDPDGLGGHAYDITSPAFDSRFAPYAEN